VTSESFTCCKPFQMQFFIQLCRLQLTRALYDACLAAEFLVSTDLVAGCFASCMKEKCLCAQSPHECSTANNAFTFFSLAYKRKTKSTNNHVIYRVHTDPGKVWKVIEFKIEVFQALKSLENDPRYGKVWKNP